MNKIGISPTSSVGNAKSSISDNGDETQENLVDRYNSNTMVPQENYQEEEKNQFELPSPQIGKAFSKPIASKRKAQSKKVSSKRVRAPNKAKKFVDIDKMLDSDSDELRAGPPQIYKNNDANSEHSFDEDRDQVLPLPMKKGYHKSSTKKASNIKTKRMRKPGINQQNTISSISQDNSNSNYDKGFTRSESLFDNQNFSNMGEPMQQMNNNSFGPSLRNNANKRYNSRGSNMFKKAYENLNSAAPVLQPEQHDENKTINLFDSLKYGTVITLNTYDKLENSERKINTKLRISDKVNATKMGNDEYNINCLWKIVPSSQHMMQDKILNIIETDQIPPNIEIEYDNFSSEVEANSASFLLNHGKQVKFEDTFQLYQDSSKRFLCFNDCKVDEIKNLFKNTYSDSNCYYLGCSEYSSDNTHFSFSTVANYQQEEDGSVKKYHYIYLTMFEKGKTHYLYNIGKTVILTESYKTPLTMNIIRDTTESNSKRTISRTDVVLISFANDNFYLNVPQKLNLTTGKYEEQEPEFQRWQDSKGIDFNGWWQLDIQEDASTIQLRNFNSGKYLKISEDLVNGFPFDLTDKQDRAQTFHLRSINSNETDVGNFTESEIFKIKVHMPSVLLVGEYVSIETRSDSDYMFYEDANFDKKKVVMSRESKTNTYDTFKMIIPKEDEYLELSLCIDSREYLESFSDKLVKSENVINELNFIKEGISKILITLMSFVQNKLKGKIRADYSVGEIVPHRQDMVAKVGILNSIFHLLSLIKRNVYDFDSNDKILDTLEIVEEDFEGYDNLIEILIKSVHVSIINNPINLIQSIKNMDVIQNFVFVRGCSSLLIDMFKDKNFELNKKEVHSELLYRRIFEIERFESPIDFFVNKLYTERDHNYLVILRKM